MTDKTLLMGPKRKRQYSQRINGENEGVKMTLYMFKRYSEDVIEIEADSIEQARRIAVESPDSEWEKDEDPMIDDGITVMSPCGY